MDTMKAFAMGEANRGKPSKQFDWDKAAQIIKERNAKEATAGLSGDLGATAGIIFEDGKPTKAHYVYLASTWATPVLIIDDEEIPCWIVGNNPKNIWPESALKILGASIEV